MANPWGAVTTLSSLGVSVAINCDPTSRVTQAMASIGTFAGDFTIQATLDVFEGFSPSLTAVWNNISTVHLSSQVADGQVVTILSPIAGLRLSSSAQTSGTATLTVLQEIIA
jgi:hypothetical protein